MHRLLHFPPTPRLIRSVALLLLAALLAGSACGGAPASEEGSATAAPTTAAPTSNDLDGTPPDSGSSATDADRGSGTGAASTGSLADLVSELPPAPVGFPEVELESPRPVGLTIDAIGIAGASVIEVGVEPNGDMEVPPASRVGWYRYGPTPGSDGSAILAAHIAYDGENGVFVDLAALDEETEVEVVYDDGSTDRFIVESNQRFDKEALPEDLVFARSGPSRLILITCGGRFDSEAGSYEDNVVVVARPA